MIDQLGRFRRAIAHRYPLEEEIGRGGMGVVFRARDLRHHRAVAVKVLAPGALWTPANVERFLREIGIAARLAHPHILPLFDSGETAGLLYYVTPLIEGESLRQRLSREGRLPVDEALRIAVEVGGALEYAHRERVVHRDIKPENILLALDHAIVADFGVARALAETESVTVTGVAVGTRAYMSPEQASGAVPVDGRADLYSLACVLFEMLVGAPPLPVEADASEPARGDPLARLRAERMDVPPRVVRALGRALARPREQRFATAREFIAALEGRAAPPARRAPRSVSLRHVVAAALGAGAVLAGALLLTDWTSARRYDPALVVVLPFHVSGSDPSLQFLREGMVDLLAARLAVTDLRVVPPAGTLAAWRAAGGATVRDPAADAALQFARSVGAGRVIFGAIVGSPQRLVLSATLLDARRGEVRGSASADGPVDSLPSLIDRITAHMLVRHAGEPDQRMAALTSISLPALRAYLEGQSAHRRGAYEEAFDRFAQAIALDTTFALAALNALYVTLWQFLEPERSVEGPIRVAFSNRDRLSERDRALLMAFWPTYPRPATEAEYLVARERAVVLAPDRPEAWFWYGAALFNAGRAMDYENFVEVSDSAFRRALVLDPSFAPALQRLVEVRIAAGDTAEVRTLAARFFSRFPDAEYGEYLRWRVAVAVGDDSTRASVRRRFEAVRPTNLYRLVIFAQLDGVALDDADSAVVALLGTARSPDERVRALLLQQGLMLNRGRPQAALAATEALRPVQYEARFHLWLRIGHALFSDGDTAAAAAAARVLEPFARGHVPIADSVAWWRFNDICWFEQWRMRSSLGAPVRDAIGALRPAASVADLRALRVTDAQCALTIDVLQALATGDPRLPGVTQQLDSVLRSVPDGVGIANRVVARARERMGDLPGARAALRRRLNGNRVLYQFLVLPTLATTLREEGRVAAASGDQAGAIRAYLHYLALRANPDPPLVAQADSVRREVVRLLASQSDPP